MAAYHVTAMAKNTFLASATNVVTAISGISPNIYCSHRCLGMKADRLDFTSCNGFLYENGTCHLGYAEPDWIYEQTLSLANEATLYFDIAFP